MPDEAISVLTEETAPVDADMIPLVSDAETKKVLFSTVKSTLKTYFDPYYRGDLKGFTRTGRWHIMPMGTATTVAVVSDYIYAVPFYSAYYSINVTGVSFHVSSNPTGTRYGRVGIYSDNGSVAPGDLFYDVGEATFTTSGHKAVTCQAAQTLVRGTLYWIALMTDGAYNVYATLGAWSILGYGSDLSTAGGGMAVTTSTYPYTGGVTVLPPAFPANTISTLAPIRLAVYAYAVS